MRAKYLFILLPYCLFFISASAADIINNSNLKIFAEGSATNGYPLKAESPHASWRDLLPDDLEYEYSSSIYTLDRQLYNPSIFSEGRPDERLKRLEAGGSDGNYSPALNGLYGDLHSNSQFIKSLMEGKATELQLFSHISDIDRLNSNAAYYYEKETSSLRLAEERWLKSDNQINFSDLMENDAVRGAEDAPLRSIYAAHDYADVPGRMVSLQEGSFEDGSRKTDGPTGGSSSKAYSISYDSNRFFAEQYQYLEEDSVEGARSAQNLEIASSNLQRLINNQSIAVNDSRTSQNSSPPRYEWSRKKQNYAIVVGIDEYDDKSSLHSCVNDARSVADLMNDLGYRVILLSDSSDRKPTKDNILDVSVKDMILKNDIGNIIFYFSGHGIKDDNNTFYLIPQDANGNRSTYISEYEFKRYISDLHNLAVILDVCNGAGMEDSVSSGQLMIASSEEDEPSNEEWTGSLSVFTQNLIDAIRSEKRRSNKILLQNCFYRAYNDTVHWSADRFISQTPVLIDRTGGAYYLK